MTQRFTLIPLRWYAAELIGDEFAEDVRSYSPIRVERLQALGTGRSELVLDFYHANYPEGVRSKSYCLHVLERQSRFLLARRLDHSPTRLLLLYDATWRWLEKNFGLTSDESGSDLQEFMEERCR